MSPRTVRTLTGVADGKIAAGSQDAVTGSQLSATNVRVSNTETAVIGQGARLTSVESTVGSQGTRLSNVETATTANTMAISGLQGQMSGVSGRVGELEKKTDTLSKGIAASMAMPNLSIPTGKKTAFGMDVSTYDGKQGIGATGAIALDKNWSVQGSVGGSLQGGDVGARAGFRAAW